MVTGVSIRYATPANVLVPLMDAEGWFLGVHDTSVSIPPDTSSCLTLAAGKVSKVSLMVLVN